MLVCFVLNVIGLDMRNALKKVSYINGFYLRQPAVHQTSHYNDTSSLILKKKKTLDKRLPQDTISDYNRCENQLASINLTSQLMFGMKEKYIFTLLRYINDNHFVVPQGHFNCENQLLHHCF